MLGETFDRSERAQAGEEARWERPFTEAEMKAARRALRDEAGVLSEVLALLRRAARHVPFAQDALAAYHCVRDPATPARVRFILLAALAYFVMPIDAIPDYIPFLGFTDDAAVLSAAIAAVRNAMTEDHRAKARAMLDEMEGA